MPDPQTVYRDQTRILMFVRTEDRGNGPENLFVTTRNGVVHQVWRKGAPSGAGLILDTEGRKEANELKWLLHVAEHEREIMVSLLRQATAWLPHDRAQELRKAFAETRP